MKKVFIYFIIVLIIAIIGISIHLSNKKEQKEADSNNTEIKINNISKTEGINTVLTLDDEITDDSIWCGTFQLIWNDLKNELAKKDIIFTPQKKLWKI